MAKPGRPGVLPFLLLSAALPRIGLFQVRPHPLFFYWFVCLDVFVRLFVVFVCTFACLICMVGLSV